MPTGFRMAFADAGTRPVRVPGVIAQALARLFFLGRVVLGLIVFIPLAIVAALALFVTLGVVWVRAKIARAKAPNGILDGRRNVRVRG